MGQKIVVDGVEQELVTVKGEKSEDNPSGTYMAYRSDVPEGAEILDDADTEKKSAKKGKA